MRRTLVCVAASIAFWTFSALGQPPGYIVPGQLAPAAPASKQRPKKRKPKVPPKASPAPRASPPPPTPAPEAPPAPLPVPEGPSSSAPPPSSAPVETLPPAPAPPPPSAPEPSATPRATAPEPPKKWLDATSAPPPDAKPLPTFSLRFDPSWGYRRFLDSEASSTDKRFGTPGCFLLGGRAELYPLSTTDAGILRDLGLTASYVRATSVSLTDFDSGTPVDATWYSYSAAVRARILGRTGPFALGASAGIERMVFSFDPSPPNREVPTAEYSLLAGGFDARQALGRVSLFLEASYLFPYDVAQLGDRIPNKRAYGGRGVFGVAFKVSRSFEIDAHATYTFVRLSIQPVAERADQPGRIFDQYIVSSLGLRLNL